MMGSHSVHSSSFLLLHPFSLFQCGLLHGLQSFSENLLQQGLSMDHKSFRKYPHAPEQSSMKSGCLLQHGPPMACRTVPAQSWPLPQAAEDSLPCSCSSSISAPYINKQAKTSQSYYISGYSCSLSIVCTTMSL